MEAINNTVFEKKKRYFFVGVLMLLCYYVYNYILLTQFCLNASPALIFPSIDNGYWLVLATGVFYFFANNLAAAISFDILFFLLPILILFLPYKRWLNILFLTVCFLYAIFINTIAAHHFHLFLAMPVLAFAFCFTGKRFENIWRAIRYYTLFIFVSAALWKLFRGSIFEPNQMLNILHAQHAQFLYEQPNAIHAKFIRWLITHSTFSNLLIYFSALLQILFVIGFFTSKIDTYLLAMLLSFVAVNYCVMQIFPPEIFLFALTLVPQSFWQKGTMNSTL